VEGLSLGRIPFARHEAQALARNVGAGSTVLSGHDASEHFLKRADLRPYGLLLFAALAVVDETRPQRSAVLLAAGDESEDGLLQIREIVGLDLRGKVVLLSGCRSATGEVLAGEGVMGLARAFFQAGALAVVGNLWPVRDDEAASLMEEFARGLSRGQSVATALAGARRSRIAAGAPAAAWAGLVVLGDGDVVPVPHGNRNALRHTLRWTVGLAAVLVVLLVIVWWVRRGLHRVYRRA
jgi:CHAT domain-containing protein